MQRRRKDDFRKGFVVFTWLIMLAAARTHPEQSAQMLTYASIVTAVNVILLMSKR